MKGKIHPLSIFSGITLIVLGILSVQIAVLRFETLIRDFSYILFNIFLVFNIFGLTFIWVGLTKFQSISLTNNILTKRYWFGLIKKKFSLTDESHYSFHKTNYFLFKYRVIIIDTTRQQQVYFLRN